MNTGGGGRRGLKIAWRLPRADAHHPGEIECASNMDARLETEAHERRLARLAARLPPAELPADARAELEGWRLVRGDVTALEGPIGTPIPALAQGAVALFRATALRAAAADGTRLHLGPAPGLFAAVVGCELRNTEMRPEDFLYCATLVVRAQRATSTLAGAPAAAAADLEDLAHDLELAALTWSHTGGRGESKAQRLARRLAELGVVGGEAAGADACFALHQAAADVMRRLEVRHAQHDPERRGALEGRRIRAMERACEACPLALQTAAMLAILLFDKREVRKCYGVAAAALGRADAAGHFFAGATLSMSATAAVISGALGAEAQRIGAVRPLVEGARRRLDAAKATAARGLWQGQDFALRKLEAGLAEQRAAGADDDAPFCGLCRLHHQSFATRSCTGCGAKGFEMLRCARCRAPYCSRECQLRHWPEHKAACKAAAAAAGAGAAAAAAGS